MHWCYLPDTECGIYLKLSSLAQSHVHHQKKTSWTSEVYIQNSPLLPDVMLPEKVKTCLKCNKGWRSLVGSKCDDCVVLLGSMSSINHNFVIIQKEFSEHHFRIKLNGVPLTESLLNHPDLLGDLVISALSPINALISFPWKLIKKIHPLNTVR